MEVPKIFCTSGLNGSYRIQGICKGRFSLPAIFCLTHLLETRQPLTYSSCIECAQGIVNIAQNYGRGQNTKPFLFTPAALEFGLITDIAVQSLVAKMLENGQVVVRADGPYGIPSGQGWQKYDILVIIAGGIGE